jgi:hypothetical protein
MRDLPNIHSKLYDKITKMPSKPHETIPLTFVKAY